MATTITPRDRLLLVARALTRVETALMSMYVAREYLAQVFGEQHGASAALQTAIEQACISKARLETTLKRIP